MSIFTFIRKIWITLGWYFKSRDLIAATDFWLHPGPDTNKRRSSEMLWRGIAIADRTPFKILKGQSLWSASGLEFWWLAGLMGTHQVQLAINAGWLVSKADFRKGVRYTPRPSGSKTLFNKDSPEVQAELAARGLQLHTPREDKISYPFAANLTSADRTLLWPMWGWDRRVMTATWGEDIPEEVISDTISSEDLESQLPALLETVRADLATFKQREAETGWKDVVSAEFSDVWW